MARRDPRHAEGAGDLWLRVAPTVLVLMVLAAAVVAWRVVGPAAPPPGPAAVPPPPGLSLPAPAALTPVAAPEQVSGPGDLDPRRVRKALAKGLRDRHLGPHVRAVVAPLADGGPPVLTSGRGVATPASTMKLLTATAALDVLGPEHTFATRVVEQRGGSVVLVGGGDPYLASRPTDDTAYPHRADVVTLARRTAAALAHEHRTRVRLAYDASLFTGPAVDPSWPGDYLPDGVVAPITALWVDEGRSAVGYGKVADPARVAADAFATALRRAGVVVQGQPRPATARAGARQLAAVESAPLAEIVEEILTVSDNEGAEVLAHQVGLAVAGSGSFRAGADAVEQTLRGLGVPLDGARILDGSGLSRRDRLDPRTLAAVLQVAADAGHPDLRAAVTGLPVAGFTGSLADRFDRSAPVARGRVRAKTGTLTGVSALAGVVTGRDGVPMVFALMADRVALLDRVAAEAGLDDLASALASCHCGR